MDNVRVDPVLREIASIFASGGKSAYLVGGAVRDIMLGQTPKDWDIATDATPQEVMSLFRKVIPTGIKHGTVTILYKGHQIESTTFRTESDYSDGRHPDTVSYAATIEEDLSRRDFTMNALAVELPSGRVVDPYDGRADIGKGIIRCVGSPAERFNEDGLRPVRAARFVAQLGFSLDGATREAIPGALGRTAGVAKERIRDEIDKMLRSERPSAGFAAMEDTGILGLVMPELSACRGVDQKGYHRFDVFEHSLRAADAAPRDNHAVRLAALLHDVGKPRVVGIDPSGVRTFYRHEEESARMAEAILGRLKYPNAAIKAVVHLIATHMFHYEETWSDAAVRRLVARIGEENLTDAYALRLADMEATTGERPAPTAILPLMRRIDAVLAESRALSIKDLAVNGNDLAGIGIPKGPRMGAILGELLETVIDDPRMNERDRLLEVARRMAER